MYNQAQVRALQASAAAIATKMAANEDLTALFKDGIEAKIEAARSSFGIHLYLKQLFTKEEIEAFPVVGSKEKDGAGNANSKPDIVEYTYLNGTKKTVSFWKTVAVSHPIGKMHTDAIQAIIDSDKVKNAYTGQPKAVLDDYKKTHQNKFTTFFSNLRQAVALFEAIRRGNEIKGVLVELAMVQSRDPKDGKPVFDGDKPVMEPTPSVQCIKVSDKADPAAARYFTVTNFLRLDPDRAILAGEGYVNYITSNKRGTPGDGLEEGAKIEKIDEWDDFTIAAVEFLRKVKSRPSTIQALLKHYSGAGSDDALMTIFALQEELTIITEVKALKDRAETLMVNGYTPGQGKEQAKVQAAA